MNKATVKHIADFDINAPKSWTSIEVNKIDIANWDEYDHKPQVSFKLAHNNEMLFIQYNVVEEYAVRIENTKDQDPVYEDSCVEFFIEDEEGCYHNFEFNAAGVSLSAKGKHRENRTRRDESEMQEIVRLPSGIIGEGDKSYWALTVGIPFATVGIARGKSYRANFYKCGDLTEKMHFLSWNKIDNEKPNFHLPAYFGEIEIE